MNCSDALKSAPAAQRQSDGAVAVPAKRGTTRVIFQPGGYMEVFAADKVPGEDWEPLWSDWRYQHELELLKGENAKLNQEIDALQRKQSDPGAKVTTTAPLLEAENAKLRGNMRVLEEDVEKYRDQRNNKNKLVKQRDRRIAELESGAAWVGEEYQEGELIPANTPYWYHYDGSPYSGYQLLWSSRRRERPPARYRGESWRKYTGPTTAPKPDGTPANVEPEPNQLGKSQAPHAGSVKPGTVEYGSAIQAGKSWAQGQFSDRLCPECGTVNTPGGVLCDDCRDDDGLEPQPSPSASSGRDEPALLTWFDYIESEVLGSLCGEVDAVAARAGLAALLAKAERSEPAKKGCE